ncbi:flagellar assembly factor FliW [Desulfitispora alkaliphila]|uniref:flagellar assembly protein FliW n=1 Tax=Desulfitispora alkaliphila TaxID=622674 RepID=UPI003D1C46B6
MKINTRDFGELEINPDDIILFSRGIPGFEESHRFVLIDHSEDSPFHFLQAVDQLELSFVVAEPMAFFTDYKVKLDKSDLVDIGIEREEEAVILVLVTIPHNNPQEMTANLQAPLIINGRRKLGKQVILPDSGYTTRHRLFNEQAQKEVK